MMTVTVTELWVLFSASASELRSYLTDVFIRCCTFEGTLKVKIDNLLVKQNTGKLFSYCCSCCFGYCCVHVCTYSSVGWYVSKSERQRANVWGFCVFWGVYVVCVSYISSASSSSLCKCLSDSVSFLQESFYLFLHCVNTHIKESFC